MSDLYKMDGSELFDYVIENGKVIVENVGDEGEGYEIYKVDGRYVVFDYDGSGSLCGEGVYDSLDRLLEENVI